MGNFEIFKYVILLFLGWFICLLVTTYLGLSLLPNQDFYKKKLFYPNETLQYFQRWSNWDGGGYRYIAEHSYTPILTVFFPAYPLAIKSLILLGLNSFWAAFLVSQICTVIALFFFYKLAHLDFNEKISKRALMTLLIFPTSFYFMAVYSESLTLALAVSAFYFARKRKWFRAFTLAAIATTSRLVGLAVLLGVITEYFFRDERIFNFSVLWKTGIGKIFSYITVCIVTLSTLGIFFRQNQILAGVTATVLEIVSWLFYVITIIGAVIFLKMAIIKLKVKKILSLNLLYLIPAFLPLPLYLLYQQLTFGSAFTFLKSEVVWGKTLSAPWQGIFFNLKYIFLNPLKIGETSAHIHVQLAIFILALTCLIISFYKLRTSYSIYFLIALIIPLFSGMLADISRYVLIIFPMFLLFSLIENDLLQKFAALLSTLILALLSILFFNSYFFT